EINPLSRLLQTPTIDFGVTHHHVLSLLNTFDTRETNAVNYFKSVAFEKAKQISEELLVQPAVPRTYQRRHGQQTLDPEEFYRDQVFLSFLLELRENIDKRLSVFGQPRTQLLTQLRPEHITSMNCSTMVLYQKLIEEFSGHLPQPLQLFGELERWKNACINLVDKPNYVNM
ncbi:unnamed protein product, partial [Rotaria sp. Silwood2]